MRLYSDLADWWSILSPPETYGGESGVLLALLEEVAGEVESLLELGSGAGHTAYQMPPSLEIVLVDRSPEMLASSRSLNPGRAHVEADLCALSLGRTFDAVLLHDAVMYLTEPGQLEAAIRAAAAHLRPGGALLVVPDVVQETFAEGEALGGGDDGDRAARLMEWHWDPDPTDGWYQVDFSLLLREGGRVQSVHEAHRMALFSRAQIVNAIRAAGLTPVAAPLSDAIEGWEIFLARR